MLGRHTRTAAAPADRPGAARRRARTARRAIIAAAATTGLAAALLAAGAGPAAAAKGPPAPPALTVSPAPYDYGNVTVGQTATQTFTVSNTGGRASGTVTVTLPGAAAFTITADTCTGNSVGPGRSCTVTVQFAPASPGTVTATLTATGEHATGTDTLTGTGVPAGHIYWANEGDFYGSTGTIREANLDGTDVTTLATGQNNPHAVAVDSSHIYWSDYTPLDPNNGAIYQATLDGSVTTTWYGVILYDGLVQLDYVGRPGGLAVDSSHLYWSNLDSYTYPIIFATGLGANITPGPQVGATDPIDSPPNFADVCIGYAPYGIAVDSSHIYWANEATGVICEANLDGTGVTAIDTGSYPSGVAIYGSHIYWTDQGSGTINEANLDGTDPQTLVAGQADPVGIAVDSSHIYWTNSTSGRINEANLDGTGVTTLVTGQDYPVGIAVSP